MYLEGRGVRFDFAKGRKLIETAAAKGWPEAIAKLGHWRLRRTPEYLAARIPS